MSKIDVNSTLKRLRNQYRLVIMNEDTFEEVVRFKLSRVTVYIALSTIFVLLTGLTVAAIVFTPLKYYLPGVGYGDAQQIKEYRALKVRIDSVEKSLVYKEKYIESIQKVLKGDVKPIDTVLLQLPKVETDDH